MTPTETLAALLRRAAEKMPEKFTLTAGNGVDFVTLREGNDFNMLYLAELDDTLTLDELDAIAEAVGMEFEVRKDDGDWWYAIANTATAIWVDEGGMFESKRSASIAALIAILQYKLKEETR